MKKNRKVYKEEDINRYMKIQLDIPDYLNKKLKFEKLTRNQENIKKTIIEILNEYFENKK